MSLSSAGSLSQKHGLATQKDSARNYSPVYLGSFDNFLTGLYFLIRSVSYCGVPE